MGTWVPYTLLVVDDDEDTRELLRALLEGRGHHVLLAENGRQAVHLGETVSPDVALINITLSDFDGYEVARTLRAAPGGRKMLLIALTGYSHDRERAIEAGFDMHLKKPFEPQTVFEVIERLVSEYRAA